MTFVNRECVQDMFAASGYLCAVIFAGRAIFTPTIRRTSLAGLGALSFLNATMYGSLVLNRSDVNSLKDALGCVANDLREIISYCWK